MTTLVARTRPCGDNQDLFTVAGEDGVVWASPRLRLGGHGTARRIALPAGIDRAVVIDEMLADIVVDDNVDVRGTGPIAIGALPFAAGGGATLTIPEVLWGSDADGNQWRTTITPDGADPVSAPMPRIASPGDHELTGVISEDEWCDRVAAARDELRNGAARKVVLARALLVSASGPISRLDMLERLSRSYPDCLLFLTPELVGASPELLVARDGFAVRSHPMAGTVRRSPDPEVDAGLVASLLASTKDRIEHQITIDRVHETLLPYCSYLDAEPEPSVTTLTNVHHLSSLVEGRLARPAASVLELVEALHPTPAVCGEPRESALALIDRYDGFDRGCYAGPIGWVDRNGNGEWAVGIRSAEVAGSTARLFAGVGVVADSDPRAELDETMMKFEPMLEALTGR